MTLPRAELEHQLRAGMQALELAPALAASVPRLLDYLDLLAHWNRHFNLTAVRDPAGMVTRHLLDSLAIAPHVTGKSAADLGSGAGMPGLVLAIAGPSRAWRLVDANGKKVRFLRAVVRELHLDNVEVVQARVQDVAGTFDCITSRAFASLPDMLAWGGHLLAPDGIWLAMKGQYPTTELAGLPVGFQARAVLPLAIPGLDAMRHLVTIARDPPVGAAPRP